MLLLSALFAVVAVTAGLAIHDFAENLMRFVCAFTAFQCFFHMHHGSAILSMCFILRNGLNVHRVELHYLFEDSMDFVAGFTCLFSSLYVLHSAFITMLAVRIFLNFIFRMHIIHLASFDYNHNIHYIAAIRSSTYLYFSHLKLALFCSRMQALSDNFIELLLPENQHSRQSAFIYNLRFNIILFCNSLQQLLPCHLHFFSADKLPQMLDKKVRIERSIYQHYIFLGQPFGCQQIFRLYYRSILRAVCLPHIARLDVKAFEAAEHVMLSPMVGTFYLSPGPGAPPFVVVG